MDLQTFLNAQSTKIENGLIQHIFSYNHYDYDKNPTFSVTGLVLSDDQNNVKKVIADCSLSNPETAGNFCCEISYKVEFDIDDLTGSNPAQYIQRKMIETQEQILKCMDEELELLTIDYEIEHINNWDKTSLLKEHPNLACEFNCTFLSYWASIKLQEEVVKWAEKILL